MIGAEDAEKDGVPLLSELAIDSDLESAHEPSLVRKQRQTRLSLLLQRMLSVTGTIAYALLPSPVQQLLHPNTSVKHDAPRGRTAYLDGLRGIAAVIVFIEHFCHPYQANFLTPYGEHGNWSWASLPVISLLYAGSPMVMLFFVISGFSLSLRPLKCIQEADDKALLDALASATFRRAVRLLLPCIASTFFVMIGVRLYMYERVYECASPLMELDPPPPHLNSLVLQILDWSAWVLTRLAYPWRWFPTHPQKVSSEYSFQLWTIGTELYSSYVLFLVLLGLSRVRASVRIGVSIGLILYCLWSHSWDIALFISGMLIAQAHLARNTPSLSFRKQEGKLVRFLHYAILLWGLYLVSLPDFFTSASPIYGWMTYLWARPQEWQSIGAICIIWALDRREEAQSLFTSSAAQYLGRISYALYIVHVPMLQTFGWDFVPFMWRLTNNNEPWRFQLGFSLAMIAFFPLLLWVADIFWRAIDVPSTKLARALEMRASKQRD